MAKQEVEVKVPAKVVKTPAKVKTVVRYTCDICSETVDKSQDNRYGSGMSQCTLCKRDICRTMVKDKYAVYTCWEYDPDEHGDYPDKYCIHCIAVYIPERRKLAEKHWREEEKLEIKMRKESLRRKK